MNAAARGSYRRAGLRTAVGASFAPGGSVPTWRCLCGTVNQRANHICSDCGVRRPDWYEGEDCDHDD